jgi:uncharacterized protein with FMN-binding domain
MKRVIGYVLALIFGFGLGAVFTSEVSAQSFEPAAAATQAGTNAAYRDGYYMGKHDAEQGRANHVAVGRWSSSQDRAQYQTGYDAGYTAKQD